jgi:hypothetical protein
MNLKTTLRVILSLFDGGAAAAGAAAGASGGADGGASAQGETTKASSSPTRKGKTGEYANVVFGKQETPNDTGASSGEPKGEGAKMQQHDAGAAEKGGEDLKKEFLDLVNGKYKDVYTAETQRIINRRFGEEKAKDQKIADAQPIIDTLMRHYGVADGDMSKLRAAFEGDAALNSVLYNAEAESMGMSVEQYREYARMQQENEALKRQEEDRQRQQKADETYNDWIRQASELVGTADAPGEYPDFDLKREVAENPRFIAMLRAGVPVKDAYEVSHLGDIQARSAAKAAAEMEKRVMDNVRAKGMRPNENGTTSQPGVIVKSDPSKFTKADRAEIARRVRRGERIVF